MMTTLFHLSQTIVDMQQELAREQRFGNDACANLLKGVSLLREATDALERDIKAAFDERAKAVARVLGNAAPYVTTVEPSPINLDIDDPFGLMPALHNVVQQP
jgi:DnaJ-domain-containing protein 1